VNDRRCVSLSWRCSLLRRFSSASLFGDKTPTGPECGDFSGVLFFPFARLGPVGVVFTSPRTPITPTWLDKWMGCVSGVGVMQRG